MATSLIERSEYTSLAERPRERKMRSYVYVVTNLLNDKQYVGMSKDPHSRWRGHIRNAEKRPGGKFINALRKYGQHFFNFEVVQRYDSQKEALQGEMEWIKKLSPEYNLTLGGEGALGYKHTPETLDKLSKDHHLWNLTPPMLGKNHTESTKKRISEAKLKNPTRYWLGKKRSEETVRKMRESKKGQPRTWPVSEKERVTRAENMRRAAAARIKPVICINDGAEFSSIISAAEHYGLTTSTVSHACRGHDRKFVNKGLFFKYKDAP